MKVNIILLFYTCVCMLLMGAYQSFRGMEKSYSSRYVFRRRMHKRPSEEKDVDVINQLFLQIGWSLNMKGYMGIRYCVTVILLSLIFYTYYDSSMLRVMVALVLSLYILTTPVLKWGKKESPFVIGLKVCRTFYNQKKDIELYRVLIQLKNIAVTQQQKSYSTDYIIHQLVKFATITKEGFIEFLMYYNMGKEEMAYGRFIKHIPTKVGKEVGSVLLKLDYLVPIEMIEQVNMIKEHIREEHITHKHRHQNRVSDLIYLPIIIPVFVLFLNFIMITLWIPQIEGALSFL